MSRVQDVLAKFKQGQKAALRVQSDARQEREDRLAKAAGGGGAGRGKAKAPARPRKAASGDASASVASGGGAVADWKQRSRTAAPTVPLGVKIKAVVDFLRASGEPQMPSAVAASTGFNPQLDAGLAAALASNAKVVAQDDGRYAYKPEVANLHSKQELIDYLRRRERQGEGYAALGELQDAYPAARSDLEALKKEGLLFSLPAGDAQRKEVFYPVDTRMQLKVDADLQEMWLSLGAQLPEDEDEMAAELQKIGMKPAPRVVVERREAREKKKKARKARRLTKVTNVHLAHLLEGDAPTNIETAMAAGAALGAAALHKHHKHERERDTAAAQAGVPAHAGAPATAPAAPATQAMPPTASGAAAPAPGTTTTTHTTTHSSQAASYERNMR
ncbi:transcription initiation factor IIE subunit beta [Micractinium conductrix]|uniref:Transcription initiation factor IIE subunit beta n=1 Tax=Micractinium conductrix TaxID=554055 RepID=A0A2P6VHG4_9CHLO|nr:transcription initiation factor IIE subunit beta [Micractinium conductrix]|eukprot:PSC73507.1 transcription initiation factor IIE subunit beta [Micractinium conductrix]